MRERQADEGGLSASDPASTARCCDEERGATRPWIPPTQPFPPGLEVRYRITHTTEYVYESVVSSSFGEAHLAPRDLPHQRCGPAQLRVVPEPSEQREHLDYFGNRSTYFSVLRPHTKLVVTSTSEVEVTAPAAMPLLADQSWETVRDRLRRDLSDDVIAAREYVLESPLITITDAVRDYAAQSFPAGRAISTAIADLATRINHDFLYKPGVTTVTTTLDELMELREGVCQDFAHLAIACARSVGLAARYVSGYLETDPPPGRPKLQGADVSHAWMDVFLPDAGWIGVDPTNDQLVSDRYVTTAWGRDYGDVPPLKGVIYTEGSKNELRVQVDVVAISS
jgi:transglutaminase-like putative cysteine protease